MAEKKCTAGQEQPKRENLAGAQPGESRRRTGKAAGRKRENRQAMREILQQLMDREVRDEKLAQALREEGLAPSVANAVGMSVVKKAVQGEVTAVRFLRDTMEDKAQESELLARSVQSMDLTRLSDAQLEELADRQDGERST